MFLLHNSASGARRRPSWAVDTTKSGKRHYLTRGPLNLGVLAAQVMGHGARRVPLVVRRIRRHHRKRLYFTSTPMTHRETKIQTSKLRDLHCVAHDLSIIDADPERLSLAYRLRRLPGMSARFTHRTGTRRRRRARPVDRNRARHASEATQRYY